MPIQSAHCLLIPEPAKKFVASVAKCLSAQRTLPVFLESLEIRWSELLSQGLLIFRGKCRKMQQAPALVEMFGSLPGVVGIVFENTQANRDRESKSSVVLSGQGSSH